MNTLYETIERICTENKITIGKLCGEIGAHRSMLSDLKSGRKKTLATETLTKIAEYFGVTVDYLLGNEQKETPTEKVSVTKDDIKFALFGNPDIDDEIMEDVMSYAKFKAAQKKKKE